MKIKTPLPVTVISGFLGSGKTTLLQHILNNQQGLRVAVIVNDMSEVNIDAALVKAGSEIKREPARMVEMTNGCICCTLREDLLVEVGRLARENRFDYLVIESTGISEPLPVAMTFTFEDKQGESLSKWARLDTMVSVVDVSDFITRVRGTADLAHLGLGVDEEDERTLADLLIDQVEFADVLILNKTDLVGAQALAEVEALLRKLNPVAKLLRTQYSRVALEEVLNTELFDMDKAESSPGWIRELNNEHTPETEEYGVSSFVYRAWRPFHPERLSVALGKDWKSVLRAKGFFWLATRHDMMGVWAQAGESLTLDPMGPWLAGQGAGKVSLLEGETAVYLAQRWKEPYGDRRQELVFIGVGLDPGWIEQALNDALLDDQEMEEGPNSWQAYPDPLPQWAVGSAEEQFELFLGL